MIDLPKYNADPQVDPTVPQATLRRQSVAHGLAIRLKVLGNVMVVFGIIAIISAVLGGIFVNAAIGVVYTLMGIWAVRAGNALKRGGSAKEDEDNLVDALSQLRAYFTVQTIFFLAVLAFAFASVWFRY